MAGTRGRTVWVVGVAGVLLNSLVVVFAPPAAADTPGLYTDTTHCVAGTFHVKHGVTQVHVHAIGAAGTDGWSATTNVVGGPLDNHGGTGGRGSSVETTIPVTAGMTLYVGVANSGMHGGASSSDGYGGAGGAASWVTDEDPMLFGTCLPARLHVLVAAAGGGGGGGTGNRNQATPGGAGGEETVNGGNGGDGGDNSSEDGAGGHYSDGTSGGTGGNPGTNPGCTGGTRGGDGSALIGGDGGSAGLAVIGSNNDCSTPPGTCSRCPQFANDAYGGSGAGGGGGWFGGGGGGGATDSGFGAGGGGAAGRSYAKNPASFSVAPTRVTPFVTIEAVTTPVAVTSADHVTFTRGSGNTFTATATGVPTPYVDFTGTRPQGVTFTSATFADDGSGAGSAQLSGVPSQDGVFPLTVRACNDLGCDEQPFTLTVNGAPTITSPDTDTFVVGSLGTHPITTAGYPAPSLSMTGAPAWLALHDNGNGTGTLTGTPPAGAASQYTVTLGASNGIGSDASQTLTLKVVTSLVVTPSLSHLMPYGSDPSFAEYLRSMQQQLHAIGTFPGGGTGDISGFVRWSSSSDSIATVTQGGFVTAHNWGTATISAATAATSATATVVVQRPQSIAVTPPSISLMGGQTQQFTATACYANPCASNSYDITHNVRWHTLNPTSAQVTSDGFATASAGGSVATIRADLESALPGFSNVFGDATITVTHGNVVRVDVSPQDVTVATRTTVNYHAMLVYQDGTLEHDTPYVTWSVTGIATATIGPAGDVYSPDPGTLTIHGTSTKPGSPAVEGTATLHVIRLPSSLTVSPVSGSLFTPTVKGTTRQYKVMANYSDGAPSVDVSNGVEWLSGNTAIATVSQDGVVTALANQDIDVPIFARYTYDNGHGGTSEISGSTTFYMTILPPVSITIAPTTVPTLHPNDTQQFTLTGHYADGSTVTLPNNQVQVTWETSNFLLGEINNNGLVHIVDDNVEGTFTVSARYVTNDFVHDAPDGYKHSNNVTVTVTDPLDHVSIRSFAPGGSPSFITAGQVTPYGYWIEGYDVRNHSFGDVTAQSTVSISPDGTCDYSVALSYRCGSTIADANGLSAPNHRISGTTPGAVHPDAGGYDIAIVPAATDHIEVTGGSTTITAGDNTLPYHVHAFDQYGNDTDVTNLTSFSVQPVETTSGCVSPSASPTCHATTAGAHTVRAAYQGLSFVKLLPLWVNAYPALDHITLSGGSTSVPVGTATAPYVVTGFDKYGNSGNITDQTVLDITPDGTCDDDLHECTPATRGAHSVTASNVLGAVMLTSNAKALTSVGPPTITVQWFHQNTPVVKGVGLVGVRFTVTNPNTTTTLHGIGWSATIPTSLSLFSTTRTCNADSTFALPTGGFTISGVNLNPGASCYFEYDANTTVGGRLTSTTSGLTSTEGGAAGADGVQTAFLDVLGPPILTKAFVPGSIMTGTTTPLTFTVTNPNTVASGQSLSGVGFTDTLPSGLAYDPATISGTCGGATPTATAATLTLAAAAFAPEEVCTFSVGVVANTTGLKHNVTSSITSTQRGNGTTAQADVVVTEPVNHFDIILGQATAGVPKQVTVTARDAFGNVMTDYAGHPTVTGDFTDSGTGCGAGEAHPCSPTLDLPQFVAGVGTLTITAYHSEFGRSVTVTDGAVSSPSSPGFSVAPGAFDHFVLTGGSASINAGDFTLPYGVDPFDKYGNQRAGHPSVTLSISPDGLCGFDSCQATVADSGGTHHTVTGTIAAALHPTATRSLVVGTGPLAGLSVTGGSPTVQVGTATDPYVVTGVDVYGNDLGELPTSDVTLTLDPEGTCDDTTRTCTPTHVGPHFVFFTHVGGYHTDVQLAVTPGPLDHLVLSPSSASVIAGAYQGYLARGYDAYGNSLGDVTGATTFTTAGGGGACTGSSCTATSGGDHTVTGTDGSATGTATLTVTHAQLWTIALTGGSATVGAGVDTAPYVVTGYDRYGNSVGDVTADTTLSISPDGQCSGATCYGQSIDSGGSTHTVTATNANAGGNPLATKDLVVTVGPVDHIVLNGGSPTITAGESTAAYQAEGYDQFGHDAGDVTNDVTLSIGPNGTCDNALHTCTAPTPDSGGTHHTVTGTHATAPHPTATSNVVVTGPVDHFGIAVGDLNAGEPTQITITAYEFGGGVKTDYSGTPVLSGNLGTSDAGCGVVGTSPCAPVYDLSVPFSHGVGHAFVTGFRAQTGRTLAVTSGAVSSTSDEFAVRAGTLDHIGLTGGNPFVAAGGTTDPFGVEGYDHYGNDLGDVTHDSTISLFPNGSCPAGACTATVADTGAGHHTVVAFDPNAPKPKAFANLVVNPAPVDHITMTGGSPSVAAGISTAAYHVEGWDVYGNDAGDVTGNTALSIAPDGTCDDVLHRCQSTVADSGGTHHTVTGTYALTTHLTATSSVVVTAGSLDHIGVTPALTTVPAGAPGIFTARSFDAYDNLIAIVSGAATWSVVGGSCSLNACSSTAAAMHAVSASYLGKTAGATLNVVPGPLHHIVLLAGSTSVAAGFATAPYQVEGYDSYGNDRGDRTANAPLSITPDGTCEQVGHTCTPAVSDVSPATHTVTATDPGAVVHTATRPLIVMDASADLRMTKTGPSTVVPGTNVTYALTATNLGPAVADTVVVNDPLPAGTTYVSDTHPLNWTCGIVSGAYRCTRTSLTTALGVQAFSLVLHVGPAVTGSLSNTAAVSSATQDLVPGNNTSATVATTVACTRLITGLYAGDLLLSGAGSTCLRGATVTGKLTVQKGAVLVANNSTVGGAVATSGSGALSFCGTTLKSSVNIDKATGFVLFGDPGDDGCTGNNVIGSVSLTNGTAGVDVRSNVMKSSLNVDQNKGGGPYAVDQSPVVAANTIAGRLTCRSNTPAPVNGGQLNSSPTKSGQCATL